MTINPTDRDLARTILASTLRSAGSELSHIAGMISGRREVQTIDLVGAVSAIDRARQAIDHYAAQTAPAVF